MNENLASDFVAIWQSELTAMAADRELRESWGRMLSLWALTANTALGAIPHDFAPGGARPAQSAGTAPAAAASGARDAEIEQLARRVAELEQRLANLTGSPPGNAD